MEHVVTSEVFRGRADRHATVEHLQPDVCPLADGFEVDATVDEGLHEVAPPGAQRVCPNRYGSGHFVCVEKLDGLKKCMCEQRPSTVRAQVVRTSATGKSWKSFSARNSL